MARRSRYAGNLARGGRLLRAGMRLQRALLKAYAPAPAREANAPRRDSARKPRGTRLEPGRFVGRVYRNRAGTRHYKVYAPAKRHAEPLPLVVMLHGCAQDPDDFAAGTRMNELAEELGFIVAYPAQSSRANRARCWNWFEALHQKRDEGEPSLIAGITRALLAHALDERRVYIAGLSAGGAMAAVMAAEYPDLYAAVGVHSGLPPAAARDLSSALAAMRGRGSGRHDPGRGTGSLSVPVIAFHGDEDTTVHPSNSDFLPARGARIISERGERNGRAFTRTAHFAAGEAPTLEQWIVHGAGHAWFGGNPRGSFADPRGPEASREMLRFFLLHRR